MQPRPGPPVARPILKTRRRSWAFLLVVGVATLASLGPFYTKHVTVKLLPFDNKSDLQVVLDLPKGSSVEDTHRTLRAIVDTLPPVPETVSFQTYAGTAAPVDFNGLVRHHYLRSNPERGQVAVNLSREGERDRASHAVALDMRERLEGLGLPEGAVLKVVEPPPGPPVIATLLAEIYAIMAPRRPAVRA